MKKFLLLSAILCSTSNLLYSQTNPLFNSSQIENTEKLIEASTNNDFGFENLTFFLDEFGHRFSGSESLENSIDWLEDQGKAQGFDSVWSHPVIVPNWKRGKESAHIISPRQQELPMLSMGGSIGTSKEGIQAEVVVVKSFEELIERKDEVPGRIVLFNVPFTTYGSTVIYRLNGAVEASKLGAVASLIASVASFSMQTPHTGTMRYQEDVKKIPHAAITTEDAGLIQRLTERGETVVLKLNMDAKTLDDAVSRNLVFEMKGSEFPEEIVVMGGHIDSWDVGQGATDDAGGCFAAWEALRLMKVLGIKPKRTIRIIFWTNEENGLRGAEEYLNYVRDVEKSLDNHVLAIESDSGVFDPKGFGFSGSDEAFKILTEIGQFLKPIDSGIVTRGGGGADIGPLMRSGVPGMGLVVEGEKYFWYHHTAADTIDKLSKKEFNHCVATMAVFAYLVADLDYKLPN